VNEPPRPPRKPPDDELPPRLLLKPPRMCYRGGFCLVFCGLQMKFSLINTKPTQMAQDHANTNLEQTGAFSNVNRETESGGTAPVTFMNKCKQQKKNKRMASF
jgi:hypothetical protein